MEQRTSFGQMIPRYGKVSAMDAARNFYAEMGIEASEEDCRFLQDVIITFANYRVGHMAEGYRKQYIEKVGSSPETVLEYRPITMCSVGDCAKKETCYRSWAEPSQWGQGWFANDPRKPDGSCDHYSHRIQPKEGEK